MSGSVVLVHGGAGMIPDELHEAAADGTKRAAARGREVLRDGGDCVDAAVAAVRVMELEPAFNAGRGACMTIDAQFEVDAAIMRSIDLGVGAVAGVQNLADPILVAREVLEHSRHSLLAGIGAERWARARNVGTFGRETMWTQKAADRYHKALSGLVSKDGRADTVGAVVRDDAGNFAAAGSTGGVLLKLPGRVGDTPMVGPGLYAHPELGAAAATGVGEAIIAHVMSYEVLRRLRERADGEDPELLARTFCDEVRAARKAAVGIIGLTAQGQPFVAHACRHMSWALSEGEGEDLPVTGGLRQDDRPQG